MKMLPADDSSQAIVEPNLSTVTNDEFFDAAERVVLLDENGQRVDHTEGVIDDR